MVAAEHGIWSGTELQRVLVSIGDPCLRTAVYLSAVGYPCREIALLLPGPRGR